MLTQPQIMRLMEIAQMGDVPFKLELKASYTYLEALEHLMSQVYTLGIDGNKLHQIEEEIMHEVMGVEGNHSPVYH